MMQSLSSREKLMVGAGVICCLITLVYFAMIQPYNNAIEQLDSKIASRSKQLQQVQHLQQQYLRIQTQINSRENRQQSTENFSLFSFIESHVTRIARRENLTAMRPLPATNHDKMIEQAVEIKLEKVSLGQMMQLLQSIDSAPAALQVKTLQLKVRFDNPQQLDASLHISAYSKK